MDQLRSIATSYYLASSTEIKQKVHDFIKALDKDGNGQVDIFEFKQSLKEQGYKDYARSDFFNKLDINGDKSLDMMELMTLYYIIMTGRPFCSACENFIMAEYFVCVECFEKSSAPIYLCPSCYKIGYKHSHSNKNALFLDTYAMLESRRLSSLTKKEGHKAEETYTPSSLVTYTPSSSYSPSSSVAIVSSSITSGRLRDSRAFKTLETALGLANLKVGLLTLGINACTIM